MILKQSPDDFQVEELTDLQPSEGPFALYRLEKQGWSSPDALFAIRRRWQIDRRRLSFGGLKDRHASTTQHFTIYRGPQRKLTHQGFNVVYLGQVAEAFTSDKIRANRFSIVLRDVSNEELPFQRQALEEVRAYGVPNYFDDQRFGSLAGGGAFLAKSIILGDYEGALRLALTTPYEYDRSPQRKEKAVLRGRWGKWNACLARLSRGDNLRPIEYLAANPGDFRGALERLRPELRTLYLSAYQSHLWNNMLASWLRAHVPADQMVSVALRLGAVPMQRLLSADQLASLRALALPLPSPKAGLDETDPRKPYLDETLGKEGLTLEQFKLKDFSEMFFSRGERAALCMPEEMTSEVGNDETRAGQRSLRLAFTLPRGCYATLVVKRLQAD